MGNAPSGSRRRTKDSTGQNQTEYYVHSYKDLRPASCIEYEGLLPPALFRNSSDDNETLYEELNFVNKSESPPNKDVTVSCSKIRQGSKIRQTNKTSSVPPVVPPKPKLINHALYKNEPTSNTQTTTAGENTENSSLCNTSPSTSQLQTNVIEMALASASISSVHSSHIEKRSQPPLTPFPKSSKQITPSSATHSASQLNSCRQATVPSTLSKPAFISNRTANIDHVEHYENEENDSDCFQTNFLTHAKSVTNLEFTACPENIKLLIEYTKSQKELIIAKLELKKAETEDRRVRNQVAREAKELLDKTIGVQCAKELSDCVKRNMKEGDARNGGVTINQKFVNKFGPTAKFGNNTCVGKGVCVGSMDQKKENCTKIDASVVSNSNTYVQDPTEIRGDDDTEEYEIITQ